MEKQINVDVKNEKVTTIISSTGAHETCNFEEAGLYDGAGEVITNHEEIEEILKEDYNPHEDKTCSVNIHFV